MNCPKCGSSRIKSAFGSGGIESTCLDCAEPVTLELTPSTEAPVRVTAVASKPPVAVVQPKSAKVSERDVITMARRQLRELNAEIKRLKKLETQRDAIKRLLAAADAKPAGSATVRALRSSSSER